MSTTRGSPFMTELLKAIAAGVEEAGHTSELALDAFPRIADSCVYVAVPHEFQTWADPRGFPDAAQRTRTIAFCTENPGTEWFDATQRVAPAFAAAVSINRSSAAELERRGMPCDHIQLGYSTLWDSWRGEEERERPVDLLYLGAADRRRDPLLASMGSELWARNCQLLVPPLEPRTSRRPDFLIGADKYDRLRASRVLLNLHRATSAALEWMRFLEAMANGCVVVSEPCVDSAPLVPGRHFVEAPTAELGGVLNELLDDPRRLQRMRSEAYDFIRGELTMRAAGERLARIASELPREPRDGLAAAFVAPDRRPESPAGPPLVVPAASASAQRRRNGRSSLERLTGRAFPRRRPRMRVLAQTPSFAAARPEITVVCVLSQGDVAPLESTANSRHPAFEVLALSEAHGEAHEAVCHFAREHADLPARLMEHPGGGRGRGWNLMAQQARGTRVLLLDDAAVVFPSTLARLARALDDDLDAAFAYPMVATQGADGVELGSSLPWEPERLRAGNWIEPVALFGRRDLVRLGGVPADPDLAGWEEYALWCRCAEAHMRGIHVPQVLALRATRGATDVAAKWQLMRERFPTLFGARAASDPAEQS